MATWGDGRQRAATGGNQQQSATISILIKGILGEAWSSEHEALDSAKVDVAHHRVEHLLEPVLARLFRSEHHARVALLWQRMGLELRNLGDAIWRAIRDEIWA